MPLKAIVNSLDNVEESLRDFYEETQEDGNTVYVLDIDAESIRSHPHVLALKRAHNAEKERRAQARQEITDLTERLNAFPEEFDPDEYARLQQLDEEVKDGGDKSKAERESITRMYEEKVERIRADGERKLKERDEAIAELRETNHNLVKDRALDDLLAEVSVAPEHRRIVRSHIGMQVSVIENEDGEPVPVIKTDLSDEYPLADYVREWADSDEGRRYIQKPAGSLSNGGRNGQGKTTNNPWAKETYNRTEQYRIIGQDPEEAKRLKREAGVSARR
ncbi:MAG: hypothetical protein ROR55_19925 [Devosia sp.]